ncbi:MFS transporter [Paenibacillus pinihumi]|uniref:MFS transporter n=1 Tax=Paenibacillus pinihumi TaxID=669462 RepID=UPI00040F28BC|nr:MFS transporter [Paenibacillus pinihumi]
MERTKSVWQAPFNKDAGKLADTFDGERSLKRKHGSLDKQAALLLAVQALFAVANALSGTFVPVYLWKASQSFMVIGWFTLFQHFISGVTCWLAGKWVKEGNKMNSLRTGVVLSGIFYLAVLLLGQAAKAYVIPLGIINGLASGFFWLAYNVVYFEITEPDNRDRFNGWAGLLVSGSGIIAPWISGVLITAFAGNRGYQIIFTVSLIVFAMAAVISFFLKKRKTTGAYDWSHAWRNIKDRRLPWRNVFFALMAQGLREGVFMFLVGLMVYIATTNERKLGDFTLWTSLVGLIAFWLIGRWMKREWRKQAMLVGVIMMVIVIIPLLWKLNYTTLLWFGIGTALFIPLYSIPMTSSVFDMIGQSEESALQREEYVILRELGLVLGRMLSLAIYLLVMSWTTSPQAMVWLLLGVGAAPLIGWWLMKDKLQRVS